MRPGIALSLERHKALRALATLWLCVIFALAVANPAQAQSQTSIDVRLAIFGELTITKVSDMDFGNIAENGGGTIVMSALPATNCTASANIVHTGACQPAVFGGKGETGRIVRIKKPPSQRITLTGPAAATMTIDDLVIDGSPPLSLIQQTPGYSRFRIDDPTGIFDFRVGGTLNVAAGQAPGVYTGTFTIDIQYN